ncbi:hypothetical protein PAXRUDRAFT_139401, partial [Paxillus rubicundulus Ve08.2h10]
MDDLLLAASSRQLMNSIKAKLSVAFKMHNLREAKYILVHCILSLGIKINCDWKLQTVSLSQ